MITFTKAAKVVKTFHLWLHHSTASVYMSANLLLRKMKTAWLLQLQAVWYLEVAKTFSFNTRQLSNKKSRQTQGLPNNCSIVNTPPVHCSRTTAQLHWLRQGSAFNRHRWSSSASSRIQSQNGEKRFAWNATTRTAELLSQSIPSRW